VGEARNASATVAVGEVGREGGREGEEAGARVEEAVTAYGDMRLKEGEKEEEREGGKER